MHSFRLYTLAILSLAAAPDASQGASSGPAIQVSGDLCTGGTASGTGLRGAYYSGDPRIVKPALIRLDPRVESAALQTSRRMLPTMPVHTARWCGWIRPIVSGPHRFSATAKKLRVEINKKTVTNTAAGESSAVEMQAGKAYAILVEIQDADKTGEFSLQWTPPFGVTYAVPPTVLFPPVATVDPGC
ncbi:MAG: PA14 domain-containing protein [Steroidobacteraceae bacterium]